MHSKNGRAQHIWLCPCYGVHTPLNQPSGGACSLQSGYVRRKYDKGNYDNSGDDDDYDDADVN